MSCTAAAGGGPERPRSSRARARPRPRRPPPGRPPPGARAVDDAAALYPFEANFLGTELLDDAEVDDALFDFLED